MAFIVWHKQLETGVSKIDDEHESLIRAMNRLQTACVEGKPRDEVAVLFIFVRNSLIQHFSTEEEYMLRQHYPEAPAHMMEHSEMVQTIAGLSNRLRSRGSLVSDQILECLHNWIQGHFLGHDARLNEFIRNQPEPQTVGLGHV